MVLDRYLDSIEVGGMEMKKVALVALILSVKHEEGNRSHEFIFQIITCSNLPIQRSCRKSLSSKPKDKKSKSKSKDKMNEKKKKEDTLHKKT